MMSIGTWLLGGFFAVCLLYIKQTKQKYKDILDLAGLVLGFGVMGYTGLALNLSALRVVNIRVKKIAAFLAIAEFAVALAWIFSISSLDAGLISLKIITSGPLAFAFYIGFMFFGVFVPIYSGFLIFKTKLALVNIQIECDYECKNCKYAEYAVLFGGFCLRAVVIFAGVSLI